MIASAVVISYVFSSIGFIAYLFWRKPLVIIVSRIMFGISVLLHFFLLVMLAVQAGQLPILSPAQAANMMIFLSSLVFVFFVYKRSTAVLGAFFVPVASFFLTLIAPSLQAGHGASPAFSRIWYPLHTLTVISGEALFAVAFVVSIVYLVHDSIIRRGKIHTAVSSLPPLKMLDKILTVCLSLGFVAITAGMIFGSLWASSLGVEFAHLATKASAGAATWFVFAFSIHQRFAMGWAGKRTAIITIAGFILMILLFVVLNLIFPEVHGIRLTK